MCAHTGNCDVTLLEHTALTYLVSGPNVTLEDASKKLDTKIAVTCLDCGYGIIALDVNKLPQWAKSVALQCLKFAQQKP